MRYTQPQSGPARVDPAYGSTFAYNAAIPGDVVGAACVLNGSPAKAITPDGIALRFDTSAKYLAVTRKSASVLGPFNFLYVFSQLASVTNGGTVLSMPGSSGNNNKIDIYTLSGGTIRADVYNSAGTPTSVDTASEIAAGGRYAVSLIFNGATLQWRVNGKLSGSAVAFSGSRTAESMAFTIGGTASAAASANHDIKLAAFVGDRLSPLTSNPWQLFRSPQRVMLASGAPAAPTGTLTSTLGNATLAASGTVLNAGAFTSTLGNATMAAAGLVGTAPSGTMASTLADATMSAAGAATNAGTFATSLAGASMSAVGIVINRGTFSATMGDATMAAAGTVAPNATGTFSSTLDGATMAAYGYNGVPPVLAGFFHRLPKNPRHVQRIP